MQKDSWDEKSGFIEAVPSAPPVATETGLALVLRVGCVPVSRSVTARFSPSPSCKGRPPLGLGPEHFHTQGVQSPLFAAFGPTSGVVSAYTSCWYSSVFIETEEREIRLSLSRLPLHAPIFSLFLSFHKNISRSCGLWLASPI